MQAQVPAAPPAESVICRPAKRDEISQGLRIVLGIGGRLADDEQVVDFMQFALRRGISLGDLWLAERAPGRAVVGAVLPIVSPGRTLLLLSPPDPPRRRDPHIPSVLETLVLRVCDHFATRGVQLAQVLLDPADSASHRLYEGLGFARVAELVYLQGAPRRKAPPAVLPPGFAWLAYGPETHEQFIAAVAQTYEDSMDCPSLNGLRAMEDVLAGHKASGEFDPALWLVLCEQMPGGPAVARGALLLSRMPPGDTLELVYLGLTPAARGRGLGDVLVRQALATVTAQRLSRLSLAVDAANAPALKLYYRHGLQRVASKLAMMRLLEARGQSQHADALDNPEISPASPAPHDSPKLSTHIPHVR